MICRNDLMIMTIDIFEKFLKRNSKFTFAVICYLFASTTFNFWKIYDLIHIPYNIFFNNLRMII